ncbi:GGDEF domain-containing protein [Ectopseudomonas mendocina]|uniref:sensor domain-containing diguanylate cyclase n=1 Tax=Ectopseudomonas mendocina TaxID=300 RepID=UPI001AE0AB30|nr:sensor domain-containing diguanylate cyclase [Pseudomonas mendocina]MDF2073402.1 sensor domain-containing diguanylate cyclase [Pseudomonas mendocina]QTN44661.1 GGDEF domain-containing protein [Pseudomonas mendocina]
MSLRPKRHTQTSLVLLLLFLLGSGFLTTSLLSYYASRDSIRQNIVNTELPLTSDTIYSEIQKDLIRPTQIASMMSRDTFLRDWALAGEQNPEPVTRYLREIQDHYGTFTAFFISEKTRTYYQAKGVLKQVQENQPRDAWYFRVRSMDEPYEISVDPDMANADRLTFFINFKVFDYQERFIGVAGVGLTVDAVVKLVDDYQRRYDRNIFFTDRNGHLVLTGVEGGPMGARRGQSLSEVPGLEKLLEVLPQPKSGDYRYDEHQRSHFLNVRYIPELEWFLFVDKHEEGALAGIRHSLYLNLLICLLVTAVVLTLVSLVIRRYQQRIAALATTDSLTNLPNRRGFELHVEQALQEAQRDSSPLCAVMLDLDNFKQINDRHGHLAGDEVLRSFAERLRAALRQSDILCRWGGEEFILLLKNTDRHAAHELAEKLRQHCADQRYPMDGEALQVTVSLGLSQWQPGEALHDLLGRTDRALYRAKQAGRDRVCEEH